MAGGNVEPNLVALVEQVFQVQQVEGCSSSLEGVGLVGE